MSTCTDIVFKWEILLHWPNFWPWRASTGKGMYRRWISGFYELMSDQSNEDLNHLLNPALEESSVSVLMFLLRSCVFIDLLLLCYLLRALCGLWPSAWRVARWRWCTWRPLVTTWTDSEWCSEPVPDSLMSWSWQERWPIRWLQLCGRWGRERVRCNSSV